MGYQDPKRGSVKVDLPDGYWVRLRHLTLTEAEKVNDEKEQLSDTNRAILSLTTAAVEWNLDDENGAVFAREALPDVLRNMPQGDFLKLSEAFAKNEGMGEADLEAAKTEALTQRMQFRGQAGSGDQPEHNGAASTAGVPGGAGAVGTPGSAS